MGRLNIGGFDFRYGDITPRSVPGRIIATVWTLIGLILVGILTGALTSTVTTLTIKQAAKLYDTKVRYWCLCHCII